MAVQLWILMSSMVAVAMSSSSTPMPATSLRGSRANVTQFMSGSNDTRIGAQRSLATTSVGEMIDETWHKVLLDTVDVTVTAKIGAQITFDPSSCDYEIHFSSGTMEWQLNFLKPIAGVDVDPLSGGFPELLNAEGDKESGEIVFTLNAPVSFPSPLDGSFQVKVIFRKDDEDACCFQHWSVYFQAKVTTAITKRVAWKDVTIDGPTFESEESKIKEFELDSFAGEGCGQAPTPTPTRVPPTTTTPVPALTTQGPTSTPTAEPTLVPTPATQRPTSAPTASPTLVPTPATTQAPTPAATTAVYESRPSSGQCTYDDTLPGSYLGTSAHSVVMSLSFAGAAWSKRQWVFNLGQDGTGAEHWLWNNRNRVQFGTWNGNQVSTMPGLTNARTLASVYQNGVLSLYMDGVFVENKSVPGMSVNSGALAVGSNAGYSREDPFRGCIYGVNVYRTALSSSEVAAAHTQLNALAKVR